VTSIAANSQPDVDRLAVAAAWRVALSEADQESTAAFEDWLGEDPLNATAWAQVQAPWAHVAANATAPEAIVAREEALQRARRSRARRGASSLRRAGGALAAGLVLAASLGLGVWLSARPQAYETAMGERRTVTLADGSHVALDANTLVTAQIGRHGRRLELVRGQARFDVAHDIARPFTVRARNQVVVATGTSFNVDLLGPKVLVTLLEGRVTVLEEPRHWAPIGRTVQVRVVARLTAGQQLIETETEEAAAAPVAAAEIATTNLDRATAWQTGQLVFENEPLRSVAERVSRYSRQRITVDRAAGDLRVSGVFNAGDVSTFIDAVQQGLPVRASQSETGDIQLALRAP